MKRWQWLILAVVVILAILIPMPEDAPKARESGNTKLNGSVMPEVGENESP